ncbi:MAG: DUF4091 domain-containing protein [Bryobacteraceae bacterium]|nr:DUF4091 domain-containing protein [Bryobacteraceae bacterium]
MRIRKLAWTMSLAAGLVLLVACNGGSSLSVWQVDSLLKVFPDDKPGANKTSETWLAPRNGHASVQIAVRSARELAEFRAETDPPENGGAKLEALTRWVDYVPVGSNPPGTPFDEVVRPAPALFPDPLRENFPFSLPANKTYAIWVTVRVPAGAQPGDYSGRVRLLNGDDQVGSAPFQIRVVSATIPEQQTLRVTNWFNFDAGALRPHFKIGELYSPEYWELLENIGRVMADHRQNVIITPVSTLAIPKVQGGAIAYDFSRLDQWVETFRKAGVVGTIEGGHLLGRASGFHTPMVIPSLLVEGGQAVWKNLEPDDPRAERYLRTFLPALYAHLKEKGWEKQYIQHIHDEPHDLEAPIYRKYGRIIRESLPGVPTIDAVGLDQDIGFFADVCDIWVPVLSSFDHQFDKIRSHVGKGGQAWFYTCIGPQGRYLNRFIDLSLLKVRLLHWFNFRHELTGFLHWGGNYWGPRPFQNVQTVINDNRTLLPAGDNALVYPNAEKNSILSSIRLEAMRDGIEDYELLVAMAGSKTVEARSLAAEVIPHINDYIRDPGDFRRFHKRLLEALP